MDSFDLISQGLKQLVFLLNENKYIKIDTKDDDKCADYINDALNSLYWDMPGEVRIKEMSDFFYIDRLSDDNNNYYYVITTYSADKTFIIKSNNKKPEELLPKYDEYLISEIKKKLNLQGEYVVKIGSDNVVILFRINESNRKDEKILPKEDKIIFHNVEFNIKYNIVEENGSRYIEALIDFIEYEKLLITMIKENFTEMKY